MLSVHHLRQVTPARWVAGQPEASHSAMDLHRFAKTAEDWNAARLATWTFQQALAYRGSARFQLPFFR